MDNATVLTLLLSFAGILATAVWTVASIKSTTKGLTIEMQHISSSINRHADNIEKLVENHADHETRIRLLESREQHRKT